MAANHGDSSGPTGQAYEYDEENRLTTVKRASDSATLLEILYDAVGRRVESIDHVDLDESCGAGNGPTRTRHIYVGPATVEEYTLCDDGQGGLEVDLAREFLWGARFPQPVAMIDHTDAGDVSAGTPEVLHYLHDALGSVITLTDAGDPEAEPPVEPQIVERYDYEPYGQTLITDASGSTLASSAYGNPFAWTGQRYDASVIACVQR